MPSEIESSGELIEWSTRNGKGEEWLEDVLEHTNCGVANYLN